MKSFLLMLQAEEISKQHIIASVRWLLVVTLMKIKNKMKQAEQGKIENIGQFEENRNTRKQNGAKFCVLGDKEIQELNKVSGFLGVDPTLLSSQLVMEIKV